MDSQHQGVLVVGGGIAGVTAAIESAELGQEVILVEKEASLGGRVAQLRQYFPKLCPPYCGLEINYRRIKENPKITVLTLTEVCSIKGTPANYEVTVKTHPRYLKADVCDPVTPFSKLEAVVDNPFNYGKDKMKPVQVPHEMAYPYLPVVSPLAMGNQKVRESVSNLKEIDLQQQSKETTLKVGSIIWATGWVPYDPKRIDYLNYGKFQDILSNVEMERLCAPNGPTKGKLLRPSDQKPPSRVAFVQCAGSRDENHLPYCSSVCCMASLKQALYVRECVPESEVFIFYIDIRANRYESFYRKVQSDEKIHFIRGKPGRIERDPSTAGLVVISEDMLTNRVVKIQTDLVVLACGMVPETKINKIPAEGISYDEFGFVVPDPQKTAIFAAGCVKRPLDVAASVQDATSASLKSVICE